MTAVTLDIYQRLDILLTFLSWAVPAVVASHLIVLPWVFNHRYGAWCPACWLGDMWERIP